LIKVIDESSMYFQNSKLEGLFEGEGKGVGDFE
jgi:hypothetical protein